VFSPLMKRQRLEYAEYAMPSSSVPRYYWDACVFLAYISGEQSRLPDLEALLDSAEKGEIEIYTSELSVVEVAFAATEGASGLLDPAIEHKINSLWDFPSPVKRIDIYPLITREARGLIRVALSTPGQKIKPPDAIHMATARRLGVDALHTYEDQAARSRWAILTGLQVKEPIAPQPQLTPQTPTVPGPPSPPSQIAPPPSSPPP